MHTSLNTAGSNNYFRPVGTAFLQTNEEKILPRSSFKVAFSIRPVFPSMMHRAQQGIHLSGMAVLTPTATAHLSVLRPAASALASPARLHRASTPCKASFFSVGQHPILPKVMGKNWLVWEIRLSQDRNGWTRGWRICTLWRWWKERVFVVLTPEEGKAPQGHLSTPMHWDDQREQVRKKINPKVSIHLLRSSSTSLWLFFQETFEGTEGPWGVMMWCFSSTQCYHLCTRKIRTLHCSFVDWKLSAFFMFGTEQFIQMFMAWTIICLGTGQPIKCTFTWHHITTQCWHQLSNEI